MTEKKDPRDYYVIDTRTETTHQVGKKNTGRHFRDLNLGLNEEYGRLIGYQQKGELKQIMNDSPVEPMLRGRAANFHDITHMTPEVVQYETDEQGLLWVKDKEDAKRIMKTLKAIDKDVDWLPLGKTLTQEELLSPPPVKAILPPSAKK